MQGIVISFRRGRHTQNTKQCIVRVKGIEKRADAERLKGKKVVHVVNKEKIKIGRVSAAHGNKGLIRVVFEDHVSPNIIGKEVNIE